MDRLTAISSNGQAYLVKVKENEQAVDGSYNTLKCIMECFNRLAEYEDTGLTPEETADIKDQLAITQPLVDSLTNTATAWQNEYIQAQAMIKELTDTNESIRNWNACEEQEYQNLLADNVAYRNGLVRIATTIQEYHPSGTLEQPKFSFAKELHDIAIGLLEDLNPGARYVIIGSCHNLSDELKKLRGKCCTFGDVDFDKCLHVQEKLKGDVTG